MSNPNLEPHVAENRDSNFKGRLRFFRRFATSRSTVMLGGLISTMVVAGVFVEDPINAIMVGTMGGLTVGAIAGAIADGMHRRSM